jgi:hypothetical protein
MAGMRLYDACGEYEISWTYNLWYMIFQMFVFISNIRLNSMTDVIAIGIFINCTYAFEFSMRRRSLRGV